MKNDENRMEIDPSRCKGCGVCLRACPRNCIVLGSDINKIGYQYARFEHNNCIACGLCFYSCPEFGAIKVFKKKNCQLSPERSTSNIKD